MSDWERVWEECSTRVARGEATIQDCIARHPEYADELRRLLPVVARLNQGRLVHPRAEYKSRARDELLSQIRSHAERQAKRQNMGTPRERVIPFVFRAALALAVIVFLLLVSGTMLAQAALPGDTLYGWKIGSENVFRTVYPDPLTADLLLMHRRAEELTQVAGTPAAEHVAEEGYQKVLSDLPRYNNPSAESKIRQQLTEQKEQLQKVGVTVPAIDQTLNKLSVPPASAATPVFAAPPVPSATPTLTATPVSSPTGPKTTPTLSAGGKSTATPSTTSTPSITTTPSITSTSSTTTTPSTTATPTAKPSLKPSQSHTPTRPATATSTATSSATPSATPSGTRTALPTSSPTSPPSPSLKGETTETPTPRAPSTETSALTHPNTPTPTRANTPTPTRAITPTPTPTPCISQSPAAPCSAPTSSSQCGGDSTTSPCGTPTRAATATNALITPTLSSAPAPAHTPTQSSDIGNPTDSSTDPNSQ